MGDLATPDNVVVVLLDSLSRSLVGAYGGTEFRTPNLDRFAQRSVRFDNHFSASLPCMPARHDILCGSMDFLFRPWGSIEVWEQPVTVDLRARGVTTMLVSDHPHLFEVGGENYHCDFTAWAYERGGETDPWRTRPDPTWVGTPTYKGDMAYDRSRGWFDTEADFPGPRTMAAAARWLRRDAPFHDRFFLFVDEFDPHEPFDTPSSYVHEYDPDWDGPALIWPPYKVGAVAEGVITEREARQIRARYGAKLTMIDHWFGEIMDALDAGSLWDSTAVIITTDHGHYLGERDTFGKPPSPIFDPLGHIPLLVSWPGAEPGVRTTLTTNVDVHATVAEAFGIPRTPLQHGFGLQAALADPGQRIRDSVLFGYWGREVGIVADGWKYIRAPEAANAPLSMYSNRLSTMPIPRSPQLRIGPPKADAELVSYPGTDVPVIKQTFAQHDIRPFWAYGHFSGSQLFNRVDDPTEGENRVGGAEEADAEERLRIALADIGAPDDQLVRLGLTKD